MVAVLRRVLNPVVVSAGLLVALPAIVVAERLRAGWGRSVAVAAIRCISSLCGVRYVVDPLPPLDAAQSHVFVPNHSSPLDIAAMLIARPDVRFAAAAEWFDVPLLGGAVRALGSVPVDRSNPRAARTEMARLVESDEPFSLVVFAQGGIPESGEPFAFKTGAFQLAIDAKALVVGVAISGAGRVLPRGHKVLVKPGVVRVRVLEPVATAGMTPRDRKALRTTTEVAVVEALAALV